MATKVVRRMAGAIVLPLLAIALVVAVPQPAAATPVGVSGRVVDSNGTGVAGVVVHLVEPVWGGDVAVAVAGPDGTYSLATEPGSYRLYARDPNGLRSDRFWDGVSGTDTWSGSVELSVGPSGVVLGDLVMPAKPSITGRITGGGGIPLAGIEVEVTGGGFGWSAGYVTTDVDGRFALGLPGPGGYVVRARDPAHVYGAVHHPGVAAWPDATVFDLADGETADASIELPFAGSLTGSVAAGGSVLGLQGALVLDSATGDLIEGALTGSDGTYDVRGLPPGTYKVAIVDPAWLFGDPTHAFRPVFVPGADVETLGLWPAAAEGTTFTVVSGAAVDAGRQQVVGHACDGRFVPAADLSDVDLVGAHLRGCELDGVDLSGADLAGADARDTTVDGTTLIGANLAGATFEFSTGMPTVSSTTVLAGTTCPGGTVSSVICAEWVSAFTVTHGGDAVDDLPGDGVCHDSGAAPGVCSLRAAVMESNALASTDAIAFAPSVTRVELGLSGVNEHLGATGDLDVTGVLTIDGSGVTIDANGLDRVIEVRNGAELVLRDAVLTGGASFGSSSGTGVGGGILVRGASATIDTVTVTANAASFGGGVGVLGGGAVVVDRSTLAANSAGSGGGAYVSTGAANALTVRTSTISGNVASTGGGVWTAGTVDLRLATVAANSGGGMYRSAGATSVSGSLISAQNSGSPCAGSVAMASGGYNLVVDPSCALAEPSDLVGENPVLGALGDNGGETATHQPAEGSAAIDRIPVGTPELCDGSVHVDQRGVSRPIGPACDIGAVEGAGLPLEPLRLVVDDPADLSDLTPGDGSCLTVAGTCTLRAAIDEANAAPTTDTIELEVDPVLSKPGAGEDANVTGDLDTLGWLVIEGRGHNVDGAELDRVLHARGAVLELREVTVTGGNVIGAGGGVLSTGRLVLDGGVIAGNVATGNGGGVASERDLLISASSIRDNRASGGGGIHSSGVASSTSIDGSTVAGNRSTAAGGGLTLSAGSTVVTRTTVSGNTSGSSGGGIFAGGANLVIERSTISGNLIAFNGGGSAVYGGSGAVVRSSVIAAGQGRRACGGSITSGGYNVSTDGTCSLGVSTDQPNTNPLLLPLGGNGGPTDTQMPAGSSPVLDAIPLGTPGLCDGTAPLDQRGFVRPDGPGCDIGAVEGAGGSVSPRTFVVDTAADATDALPGDGICDAGGGSCTLRAAVDESNAWPTDDSITLAVDPVLSRPGSDEDANASGDLDVYGRVVIEGAGHVVDGNGLDRVLQAWGHDLTARDVTITGGVVSGRGGGIVTVGGDVHLDDAHLVDNNATSEGGGIAVSPLLGIGTLTVVGGTIEGNTSQTGAGLYASGSTLVSHALVQDNVASSGPGGIRGVNAGLVVADSVITGNVGGGLSMHSNSNPLLLVTSTIADNDAVGPVGTGGVAVSGTPPTPHLIRGSTIVGNAGPVGAGIAVSGSAVVESSTVSDNRASGTGAGIETTSASAVLSIERSTIWNNTGMGAATALRNPAGALSVRGSIVGSDRGRFSCSGVISSAGYNVVADDTCALAGPADLNDTNPAIGPLGDHGGPTDTRQLGVASPGIDLIPADTPGVCDVTTSTDQRGMPRPVGGGCDAGAVEGGGSAIGPLHLVVDSSGDGGDLHPGDGVCDAAGGACTMRAAVDEANAALTTDVIELAADPVLSVTGIDEDGNATGDLDVTGWLTIVGAGHAVDGAGIDRVLHAAGNHLVLDDLTISGGSASAGGAVANNDGLLEVVNSTLDDNDAAEGAAVHNRALLEVRQSTISGNRATRGAGVFDDGERASSVITDSEIAGNVSTGDGGGVFASGASTTLVGATLSANSAADGAGVYVDASALAITGATVSSNRAFGSGGGLANVAGQLQVVDSTIANNVALAAYSEVGGGIWTSDGDTTVESSEISGNVADDGGGGISVLDSTLTISNSTLSENWSRRRGGGVATSGYSVTTVTDSAFVGNHAWDSGGGASIGAPSSTPATVDRTLFRGNSASSGGGISGYAVVRQSTVIANNASSGGGVAGSLTVEASTIAENEATNGGGVYASGVMSLVRTTVSDNVASGTGGGTYSTSGTLNVIRSTVAGNMAPTGAAVSGPTRLQASIVAAEGLPVCLGPITSLGYNAAQDGSCGLGAATDVSNTGLLVGALTDNGGLTATRLPFPGSAAADAIPDGTVGLCDASTPVDQREEPRPVGGACDRGAAEGLGDLPVPLALVVDDPVDAPDARPGDGVCDAGGGTCTLRAAIVEANRAPTADRVTLAVDPVLSLPGTYEDVSATGDLDVVGTLTVDGGGHAVDGGGIDRVFDVRGLIDVVDLAIVGGATTVEGGAMRVAAVASVELRTSSVSANTAGYQGGGIFNGGGSLRITDSMVVENASDSTGGGVYSAGGTVEVVGRTVSGNSALSDGGGLAVLSSGAMVVSSSVIDGNHAGRGGGIYVWGGSTLTLSDSTLSNNTAGSGAGLHSSGSTIDVSRSTVSENAAYQFGGGFYVSGIGQVSTIRESAVSGNSATYAAGLYITYGSMTMTNSTISGNAASSRAGGMEVLSFSTVSLVFTTVVDNSAPTTGGISNVDASVTVAGTIIGSTSGAACSGKITSGGQNRSNDTSCALGGIGNLQGVDLKLGPLADNGGPTKTHLPAVGSPARDAIFSNIAICVAHHNDQRGGPRPAGIRCDVGSVDT